MRASRIVSLGLGSMLLGGCVSPVGAPLPPRSVHGTRSEATALGPGDKFMVRVFGEQDLSGEFRVGDDGFINYPYLNRVRVAGLQASQVADLLQCGLGPASARRQCPAANQDPATGAAITPHDVLREPNVSVSITEVTSRRISVFGQVQHPNIFPHQQYMTLTQAISLAGGFTALAAQNQVRVTRRAGNGQARTFVLRVADIAEGRAPDFDLEPGDVIYVPESIA